MKVYYDFHIHSALSPCGDDDMTPCNIAAMAKLIGLDVIALTDHNSAGNCAALERAGREQGLVVLSGMELETSEEIHVVMLFPSADSASRCGEYVSSRRLKVANRPEVFGRQLYLDARDEIVGEEKDLLITATDIGVYDAVGLAREYGGIAFPAHIDRPAHGIVEILGDVDDAMGFAALEVSANADAEFIERYARRGYRIVHDSDAHYLTDLNTKDVNFLETDKLTPQEVLACLGRR